MVVDRDKVRRGRRGTGMGSDGTDKVGLGYGNFIHLYREIIFTTPLFTTGIPFYVLLVCEFTTVGYITQQKDKRGCVIGKKSGIRNFTGVSKITIEL